MVCKYLLRFDDIAPNMNWRLFNKIRELLIKYKIKPINNHFYEFDSSQD